MRRVALSLALALTLGASVVPTASAAFSVVDQSQEDASTQGGWIGTSATGRIGQTFTAGLSGNLVAIDVAVWTGYSLEGAVVEVRDVDGAVPGDTLLARRTITTDADGWISVPVGRVRLVAGERYAFLIRSDVGSVVIGVQFPGHYPDGDTVRSDPEGGYNTFGYDLAFRTHMAPANFAWVNAPAPGKALRPRAGSTVRASFTLGGDYGLEVLRGGWPRTTRVGCGTTKAVRGTTFLTRPFGGTLAYDEATGTYTISWRVRRAWGEGPLACRQLEVRIRGDRTVRRLQYHFRPAALQRR